MHNRTVYGALWIFVVLVFPARVIFAEPENLDFFKQQLIRYHDSGEYAYELEQVVGQATAYLTQRVTESRHPQPQKKLTIVFDIDETSLSNYHHLRTLGFGGRPQEMRDAIVQADAPAIPATFNLYQHAKTLGVAVFFITGRGEELRTATAANLKKTGYENWDGLFCKPADYRQPSVVPYKSGARKQIEEQGYTVVLNMGDQYSDLAGGYAERAFKLPNPYYYIP